MSLAPRIIEILGDSGVSFKEKTRTIYTKCPICQKDDKFSILKENGACICYRGGCEFGKRWFTDWVVLTMEIDRASAKKMIYGDEKEEKSENLSYLNLDFNIENPFGPEPPIKMLSEELKPINFPEFHMRPIHHTEAAEGLQYVLNRGIMIEIAKKVDMWYSPLFRRVILPIKIDGVYYGYQGRHIDNVPSGMRMRNNEGFSRESLVMFADELRDKGYAILTEGPFDALKFSKVGGAVATMGKVVTDKQLSIIYSYGIERLYLALDDDAQIEMQEIFEKSLVTVYKIEVPESCRIRCKINGKKADFGECTPEEAEIAFNNARLFHEVI